MILVAVIAVMLALCASLRSRALARQEAIEAVDRLHGTYAIRITGWEWYRRLMASAGVGDKAFYDLTRVNLGPQNMGYDRSHPICDADVEALSKYLAHFSNLKMLDFLRRMPTTHGPGDRIASSPAEAEADLARRYGRDRERCERTSVAVPWS